MNIFVYSDESGVFDRIHEDWYVYGGVIFLSKKERDVAARKYSAAENSIRNGYPEGCELKATAVRNRDKGKLFRSTNNFTRFGVVVNQNRINEHIWDSKKSKQRYLDYAYKIGLKYAFERLISLGRIIPEDVNGLFVYADQHTTATNGCYELGEALEQEFKYGTHNYTYNTFYPPIFSNLRQVDFKLCDSSKVKLIRAADIIANRIYHHCTKRKHASSLEGIIIKRLP